MPGAPVTIDNHNSGKYFLIAFGLINVLAFTLLFCALGLLASITISKWQFPLACIVALTINYYAVGFFVGTGVKQFFIKSSGIILTLLAGLILLAGLFYDVSYDGQWYHQETVYRLKEGYNPVYQTISVPADEIYGDGVPGWCMGADRPIPPVQSVIPPVNLKYLNINCFSKGTEFIEASIYQLTNKIETAKAVNLILLTASFFLCLSLFYKIDLISIPKKWLLTILLTFNPVTVIQLHTFCVDGNVACMLLCIGVISCMLFIGINNYYLFLMGAIITMAVNVKFTGLVFTALFCTAFLIVLLIYKKINTLKKVLIASISAAFIGLFCCGFNPYVTNVVKNHNIFYGLDDTRLEIQRLTPPLFKNLNRFETLFLSISAHQGWHSADKYFVSQIPKVPFSLNKEDIHDASDAQQEMSGFGPFFSGAILVAILLLFVAVIYFRKEKIFKQTVIGISFILFTVLIISECWWERFVPQFWLIPVIVLCMAECIFIARQRFLKDILYVSLGLNVFWALLSIMFNMFSTARINYQMQQLKALNKPVNVEYCMYESFKSNRVRFMEWGINVKNENVTGKYIYNVEASNTRYSTVEPLPKLPKNIILKLSARLPGKKRS